MSQSALEPLPLPEAWQGVVAGFTRRLESWQGGGGASLGSSHWAALMQQAPSLAGVPGLWAQYAQAVQEMGFMPDQLVLGQQVHGSEVVRVTGPSASMHLACDGLISNRSDVLLGVYVADCAPVLLHDESVGAVGLLHSGRKGTEAGIVRVAIGKMVRELGANRQRLRCWIGPCISARHFELDLPALIAADCQREGLARDRVSASGLCTASLQERFYSYRREKGSTGRHLFLLAPRPQRDAGLLQGLERA